MNTLLFALVLVNTPAGDPPKAKSPVVVVAGSPVTMVTGPTSPAKKSMVVLVQEEEAKKDYSGCLAAVLAGKTVYLAVGVTPEDGDYSTRELQNSDGTPFPAGRYKCWLLGDRPVMETADAAQAAAVPRAAFGDDHTCPFCGVEQRFHSRTMADGSHDHTCNNPNCPYRTSTGSAYTWTHGGPIGYPGTRGQGGAKAAPAKQQYTQPPTYTPQFQPFGGGIQFGLSSPGMAFGGCVGGG